MPTIADIEQQRVLEQEFLDSLKTSAERNRLGQFATPPALALDIARYARRRCGASLQQIRFLDPAIGTGSFYSAFRQVFQTRNIAGAVGVEVDKRFAEVASRLWKSTGLRVMSQDFTRARPPAVERFNLVLTNPPYVRHHHLEPAQKKRLQATTARNLGLSISGLAGLYTYFLFLTDAWLSDNALSVWLIPSEFMDVNYGESVKRYLTKNVTMLHIHRFCPSDVQFSDALVSSAIVVFEKRIPEREHMVTFSFGGILSKPDCSERVSLSDLIGARKWTRLPRRTARSAKDDQRPLCLSDLFSIKRGLATGANGFFVLPRSEAQLLNIPEEFTKPILPSPRYLQDSVIESGPDGFPLIGKSMSLIDCDLPEDQIRHNYPDFWSYLKGGIARRIHQGYLTSRRTPWYSQEKRPYAPYLCTYMGRSINGRSPFRFIWNKSRATAANVYLMLYPKSLLTDALRKDDSLYRAVFEFLQSITPEMFLSESRVYGGGLHKLEPKELGRVRADGIRSRITGLNFHEQLLLFDSSR